MKYYLLFVVVTLTPQFLQAPCTSCCFSYFRCSGSHNSKLKPFLNALKEKSVEKREKRKEEIQALQNLKHPKPGASQSLAVADEAPVADNSADRAQMAAISRALTPLLIAYSPKTLLPTNASLPADEELDRLHIIGAFLIKLNTAYETLSEEAQGYFKTELFTKQTIGTSLREIINQLKAYVGNKVTQYKSIKSPNGVVKEIKKLATTQEKILAHWADMLA